MERRTVSATITDVKDDGKTFYGMVAPYLSRTYIGPPKRGFFEQIDPNAFLSDLKAGTDVVALFNHNPDYLLGRVSAKTLQLESRDDGLHSVIKLPDTSTGRDVAESVSRGDITGMSFGFEVREDDWGFVPGGHAQLRTLKDVSLVDVGPVTMPAYDQTTAAVRSAFEARARQHRDETGNKALVEAALGNQLRLADDEWVHVVDMTDEWVVYQLNNAGDLRKVGYSIDGDTVTFGTVTNVRRITSYVPDEPQRSLAIERERLALRGKLYGLSMEDRDTVSGVEDQHPEGTKFAYTDSKGGKHFPISDAKHVRLALAAWSNFTGFESDADKIATAKRIVAAAKSFNIDVDPNSPIGKAAGL
jgi:HK97 family phage prohead protease